MTTSQTKEIEALISEELEQFGDSIPQKDNFCSFLSTKKRNFAKTFGAAYQTVPILKKPFNPDYWK